MRQRPIKRQRRTTSFRILVPLLLLALLPAEDSAAESQSSGPGIDPTEIQRVPPRTRVPPSAQIQRGSPGLLDDADREGLEQVADRLASRLR